MPYERNNGPQDDIVRFNITTGPQVLRDLGAGDDTVSVRASSTVDQVRLTFTSAEVGNGSGRDSSVLVNQDGGLAVRVQAENGSGVRAGTISRFDDEGITFQSNGIFTFDVRDLVSGIARGDGFDVVQLGTSLADIVDETDARDSYYINAGMGDDIVTGGYRNDFLVGGAGNDSLRGREGNDSFIGGGGNDDILGGVGTDTAIYNVATDGADTVNLGSGDDVVRVSALPRTAEIRLTFTSAEVGNASATDADNMANQDGGLAVRLQAEGTAGNLTGPISRYDDEGIRFESAVEGLTFDVRDLVSGTARGNLFDVVALGTMQKDVFDESGETEAYYINAGMGDDRLVGGQGRDFLVGGVGEDRLNARFGDDTLLGGADADLFVFSDTAGNDDIIDFVSGVDKIDLTSYGIGFDDVETATVGAETVIRVNADADAAFDFEVTLVNGAQVVESDFIFA